jgi:hypothetical protein
MGNADLAIIINSLAIIIRGNQYETEGEAVSLAITKYNDNATGLKKEWCLAKEEAPETIDPDFDPEDYYSIKKIEIFKIL